MSMGVYIANDVNNIFDEIKKLGITEANKIINSLVYRYVNANLYTDKLELTKERINENALKRVFGEEYDYEELSEFVKLFKNIEKQSDRSMGNNKRQIDMESTPLEFTDDLLMLLDDIDDDIAWSLFNVDSDSYNARKRNGEFKNTLGIRKVDISDLDYNFDVFYSNGKKGRIKISDFVNAYVDKKKVSKNDLNKFISKYNRTKSKKLEKGGNSIKVPDFSFNPKDIRSTFISLVTKTYPHGSETEVMQFMPQNLEEDQYGNYFKIIGNSDTMFTSHLDTASRGKSSISLMSLIKNGEEMIMSDGSTILGADDKAGVSVMLYMMSHNIPGFYYFFIGEERGGIGSGRVADNFYKNTLLRKIKKVVSFDRRNYYSVITSQYGQECCSNEFGDSLCKELNKNGLKLNLDPTGVFTDSANFIDYIPECTNVSVGYFNEHTHDEVQNITYLEKLAKACVLVNWDNLVIKRKVGFDLDEIEKHTDLITYIKSLSFNNELNIKGMDGKAFITIEFEESTLFKAYEDLAVIESALLIFKYDPIIIFDGATIKIRL